MILLDTHVLLWLHFRPERLGAEVSRLIRQALDNQDLAVSAITFWEITLLSKKRRLDLLQSDDDTGRWRRELLADGLREIPVDGDIGISSVNLDFPGDDPADRIIVATALVGGHQLVTEDRLILSWPGPLNRMRVA